ncbi:MAG: hypothetical protein N838_32000 [Thiohalocapsa sp. PB-PSB1]|jgi:hypothetical protein|nr:MAG: hypothetical protein N838_08505 [Thiohalocapsa sp. PB-PSB1]QQO57291.1 MAG: hypothetical protein N838_32000 [Thiohalocapsa sp. PB-PSB1]HCS91981.1 hypothetical protein [Chromatiaceae bacterium]
MISGRQALVQITSAEREQQGELISLDRKLEALRRELIALEQQRAEDYRALARVRVDLVDDDRISGGLDSAELQVQAVLEQRSQAADNLQRELEDAHAAREHLLQQREAQADLLDQANERLDEGESATQARLNEDPSYQAQRERAHEAERIAMHAEEKATDSEQELDAKGAAYRADPLFMYLWNRHYGLPRYATGSLFGWLDDKVARLIGFNDARLNYQRLLEIPQRLREYAGAARQQSEDAFAALRELDDTARAQDGVIELEQARDAEQQRLDDIDGQIAQAELGINDLLEHQAAFASGDDDYTHQAVDYLASELERDDLAELRRAAQATPFPEDDEIVQRLMQNEQERLRLRFTVENLKQTRARQQQKLEEFSRLQRDFKRQRMDQSNSGFADGAMVAMMLSNFISGILDRNALMDALQQQQRHRPGRANPTFGSGGFGRGTPWGGMGGGFSRGHSSGGFRTGGNSSSGGFSTGGGTSSGGFRTGGGF